MKKAVTGYSKQDKLIDRALAAGATAIKNELESAKNDLDPKEDRELINYIDNILNDINFSLEKFKKIERINEILKLV